MRLKSNSDFRTLRGIHFIRVRGNLAERARAHAQLLKEHIPQGPLPVLAKKNEGLIRKGPGLLQNPWVQNAVVAFYHQILMRLIDRRIDSEARDAMKGLADEIGMTYEEIRECFIQPDSMMLLARSSMMKHVLPEWIPGSLPGCTSAVAFPDWTQDGRFLACRNFDYMIVGPWERQSTVVFNEPSEAGENPYVSLTSAGVHAGGLTAMNQEGLTLFAHAHFGKKVSLRGNPLIMVGDEVIRKSKTLGQAIDWVNRRRPFANWSFVISSAREKDAAVVQMSPDRIRAHRVSDGLLTHTNYFHSEDLRQSEALLSGAYCEDLQARFCRMRQLLEPHRGHLAPQHMAEALGDHVDFFTGEERVFGNTLSVMTTIKSAIFEPESLRFWMGNRPESPIGLGNFLEVNVEKFWDQSAEEWEASTRVLPGYRPKSKGLLEAVGHYRKAYQSFHLENHLSGYQENTLEHLRKAAEVYPRDGHLWLQAAMVAFKMQRIEEAREHLEKTLSLPFSSHVSLVRDLYLARCLDLQGERVRAQAIYEKNIPLAVEPKLKKAFKRGLKRTYRLKDSMQMVLDLQFPDPFVY
jgi:hypothetical protein